MLPVEDSAKDETQTMNVPFGGKFDFDFKVSFVEETIPSHRNVWIGNGNSGMDAVAEANGIDKTQLSKGHHNSYYYTSQNIFTNCASRGLI